MKVGGIDENGLGPKSGPLVITAVVVETERYEGNFADSKKIFSPSDTARATLESLALPAIAKFYNVKTVRDIFLASAFSDEIRKICPVKPQTYCFQNIPLPVWSQKLDDSLAQSIRELRFAVLCPGYLHTLVERFKSKFKANAHVMTKLALDLDAELVVCGKSGSTKSYRNVFDTSVVPVEESSEKSVYRMDGKTVCFVKKADEKFLPVSYASIIGKYIRELGMLCLSRAFNFNFIVSGYPSGRGTAELIERMKKVLPPECSERNY